MVRRHAGKPSAGLVLSREQSKSHRRECDGRFRRIFGGKPDVVGLLVDTQGLLIQRQRPWRRKLPEPVSLACLRRRAHAFRGSAAGRRSLVKFTNLTTDSAPDPKRITLSTPADGRRRRFTGLFSNRAGENSAARWSDNQYMRDIMNHRHEPSAWIGHH